MRGGPPFVAERKRELAGLRVAEAKAGLAVEGLGRGVLGFGQQREHPERRAREQDALHSIREQQFDEALSTAGACDGETSDANRRDGVARQAFAVGVRQPLEGERRGAQAVVAEDRGRTIRFDQHEGRRDALGAVLSGECPEMAIERFDAAVEAGTVVPPRVQLLDRKGHLRCRARHHASWHAATRRSAQTACRGPPGNAATRGAGVLRRTPQRRCDPPRAVRRCRGTVRGLQGCSQRQYEFAASMCAVATALRSDSGASTSTSAPYFRMSMTSSGSRR